MRRLPILLLALPSILLPGVAMSAEIEASSNVTRVEVYPDRARVTRAATVDVVPGSHEIVLRGLPANVDVQSLRAEGEGTARVILGSVDARRGYRPEARSERVNKLQAQIQVLQDADKEQADLVAAAEFEVKYLDSLRAKSGQQVAERTLELKGLSTEVDAMADALARRLTRAQGASRQALQARRGLAKQIDALQRELQQIQSGADDQDLRVAVSVEAKTAGRLTVQVTYTAGWANWSPTYDARLGDDGKIEITYGAWVAQGTGEDWPSVALSLSTAQPALGIAPPDLEPWILQVQPQFTPSRSRSAMGGPPPAAAPMAMMKAEDVEMAGAPVYEADVATAQVETGGPAVRFAIPGAAHVPGDGTRKRIVVATWNLSGAVFERVAVPALTELVYTTAKVKNDKEFPLLAGELQAFWGDRFVGTSLLDEVSPGEEMRIPFGVDDGVKVTRKLLLKEEGKKGLFSGKDAMTYKWQTTVESLKKEPVEVVVQDRVPVSELDKIDVKVQGATTPPTEKKERGLWVWKLQVAPGKKATVDLELLIAYPPDQRPWNLP
jgi:uncharacterized protein (TIGR02231 family)